MRRSIITLIKKQTKEKTAHGLNSRGKKKQTVKGLRNPWLTINGTHDFINSVSAKRLIVWR